jgi:hypothetical protein
MATVINNIDVTAYKEHPRIVELKIISWFNVLSNQYGADQASNFVHTVCNLTRIDWAKVSGIINNNFRIQKMKATNKKRYRQELMFMGALYGESRLYTAKQHLGISHATLYDSNNQLSPNLFVSQEWLDELSSNVVICGFDTYKQEGMRFIEEVNRFLEVLGNVFISEA